MPIKIPNNLPAVKTLQNENIFVMTETRAITQDIRPLKILILNLMPKKIETETQLARLLGNTPLQVEMELIHTKSHQSKNVAEEHLLAFYKTFADIRHEKFDGMIITGAPVENVEFTDVKYWKELQTIFDYAKTHVTSTLFICWGAQAGLYHYYGIEKHLLPEKLFGVFKHKKLVNYDKLLKGTDDRFFMPHSRHSTVYIEDIKKCKDLVLLATSKEAGAAIIRSKDDKFIFITGHAEYDRETLELEYLRDINKGLNVPVPVNYYVNDKPGEIKMSWVSTANVIYMNWLNHYVYQATPYEIDEI